MDNEICPNCQQPRGEKWERCQERIKRAAAKAISTGEREDLHKYLMLRLER